MDKKEERKNKLKASRRETIEESKEAIKVLTNFDIKHSKLSFDYSKLDIDNNQKQDLIELERELKHHQNRFGEVSLDIAKALTEAREIFIKSHSESFMSWYESLGFSKDQVTVLTSRYKFVLDYPNEKDRILGLSDRIIRESINKKNPVNTFERVLSGELNTAMKIKSERENNSIMIEKISNRHDIEEAEIIEEKIPHSKVEKIARELEKKITDIEVFTIKNEGLSEEVYDKLKEALNILKHIDLK